MSHHILHVFQHGAVLGRETLVSSLNAVSQSDIATANAYLTYDFFRRVHEDGSLEREKQTRKDILNAIVACLNRK